jgi:hypothetical protein
MWCHRTAAVALVVSLVPGALVVGGAAGAEAPAAAAEVYLVQGVAETSWTLSVDGREVAADAAGKEVVGPLRLERGSHQVVAVGPGGDEVGAEVEVDAAESVDVVLHRPVDRAGEPLFTVFRNDVSPVNDGTARLTVAHTAVAPPADIRVNGEVLLADVASAEQVSTIVPGGTYPVEVVPSATDGPAVLGPVDLPVEAGTLTRVFAIGVAEERNMDAVVQVLPLGVHDATAPDDVPAGDGSSALVEATVDQPQDGLLTGAQLLVLGLVLDGLGLALTAGRGRWT